MITLSQIKNWIKKEISTQKQIDSSLEKERKIQEKINKLKSELVKLEVESTVAITKTTDLETILLHERQATNHHLMLYSRQELPEGDSQQKFDLEYNIRREIEELL